MNILKYKIFLFLIFLQFKLYSQNAISGNKNQKTIHLKVDKLDKIILKGFFKLIFIYQKDPASKIEITAEENILPYISEKINVEKNELSIEMKNENFSNTIMHYNNETTIFQSHPDLEKEMSLRSSNPDTNTTVDSNDLFEIFLNKPVLIKIYTSNFRILQTKGNVNIQFESNNMGTLWRFGELRFEMHGKSLMNSSIDSRILSLNLFDESKVYISDLLTGNIDFRTKGESRIIIGSIKNKDEINSMTLQTFDKSSIALPYCIVRQSSIKSLKNSSINIQKLDSEYCRIEAHEMAKIFLKGTSKKADLNLSDTTKLFAPKFIIKEANLVMKDFSFADIQIFNPKIIDKSTSSRLLNRRYPKTN